MQSIGKNELLNWLANSAGYTSISDWYVITDGIAVMRCIQRFWPITCKGAILSGFNWRATEEEERIRNWEIIQNCLRSVTVPIEIFEFGKIIQGRKKACYHLLVMLYFVGAIISGTATNIAFTYPIEKSLKDFLQSERVVKAAQVDVQKRRQQRKPKCYSTTPSNLTMIDGDEYDNTFEALHFSTKDLVNIFSETDLCASPGIKSTSHQHQLSHTQLQKASEKMKSVLAQNIAAMAKTSHGSEEYSALSPSKSASSSTKKPPVSLDESAPISKTSVLTKNNSDEALSTPTRDCLTKQCNSQNDSVLSRSQCSHFITPPHSISEDYRTLERPPSNSFAAIQAAAAAAVLNASRGTVDMATASTIHEPTVQKRPFVAQNTAIKRLLDSNKPNKLYIGGSPRPGGDKLVSNICPGSPGFDLNNGKYVVQARATSVAQPVRSALLHPQYNRAVSHYLNLNSSTSGGALPPERPSQYQESALKNNYIYDSKREVTSSISSIPSSVINSTANTISAIQTDEKAKSYVQRVGCVIQALEASNTNNKCSPDSCEVIPSKPPHMIGLALLSFSNSEASEAVDNGVHCADSFEDNQVATARQRPSSVNSNLCSSMLLKASSSSAEITEEMAKSSDNDSLIENDIKTNSMKVLGECKQSFKCVPEGLSVPKNLPRWPSKKATKAISPIAPSSSLNSVTSVTRPDSDGENGNLNMNDTKLTLTSSDQLASVSSAVSVYTTGFQNSLLSSDFQPSSTSITASNGIAPIIDPDTKSVKYLGDNLANGASDSGNMQALSSNPSIVHLLRSQFGMILTPINLQSGAATANNSLGKMDFQQPSDMERRLEENGLVNVCSACPVRNPEPMQSPTMHQPQTLSSSVNGSENISLSLNIVDTSRQSQLQASTKRFPPSSTSDTFLFASSTSGLGGFSGAHSLFTDLQEAQESANTLLKCGQQTDEQQVTSGYSTMQSVSTSLCASGSAYNGVPTDSLKALYRHKVTSGRPQAPPMNTSTILENKEEQTSQQPPQPQLHGQTPKNAQPNTDASRILQNLEGNSVDMALITSMYDKISDMERLSMQKDIQLNGYEDLLSDVEGMLRLSAEETAKLRDTYNRKLAFLDSFASKKAFILAHAIHAELLKEQFTFDDNNRKNAEDVKKLHAMLLSHQETISQYIQELRSFEKSMQSDFSFLSKLEEKYNNLTNNKYVQALKATNMELAMKLDQANEEIAQLSSLSLTTALGSVGVLTDMHSTRPEMDSPENYMVYGSSQVGMTLSGASCLRTSVDSAFSSPLNHQSMQSNSLSIDTCIKVLIMNNKLLKKLEETAKELEHYKAKSGVINALNAELMSSAITFSEIDKDLNINEALKAYEESIIRMEQLLSNNNSDYCQEELTAIILKNLGLENTSLPTAVTTMINEHRKLLSATSESNSPTKNVFTPSQLEEAASSLFSESSIVKALEENNIENNEHNRLLYLRSIVVQLLYSENILSHRVDAARLYVQNMNSFIQKYSPDIINSLVTNKDCQERLISTIRTDIDQIHAGYQRQLLAAKTAIAQALDEKEELKAELSQYKKIIDATLAQAQPANLDVQRLKERDSLFIALLNLYENLIHNGNISNDRLKPYLKDITFLKRELQKFSINYDDLAHAQMNQIIENNVQQYLQGVQSELGYKTNQLVEAKNNLIAERSNTELVYQHAKLLQERLSKMEAENHTLRLFSHENSMHTDISNLIAKTPLVTC